MTNEKPDEVRHKFESVSQKYKEAAHRLERVSQRTKMVFAIIEESWQRLRARRDAFVGPEPLRPSRWRVFSYARWKLAHTAWSRRLLMSAYKFISPARTDIMDAADSIGAGEMIPYLMDVYASAHREAKRGGS